MAFIDEEIAKKLKQERLKKQKEEREREERELEAMVDDEEVRKGILNGKCTVLGREFSQSQNELICILRFVITCNLVQAVDENLGDVVISCMNAGYEAKKRRIIGNTIIQNVNQSSLMRDVKIQLTALCDADDGARLLCCCFVDEIDNVLGLTASGSRHN